MTTYSDDLVAAIKHSGGGDMNRLTLALRLWRDPILRHTLRSAWRTAGKLA